MNLFARRKPQPAAQTPYADLRRQCIEGSESARRAFVRTFEPLVWQTVLARFGSMPREDLEEVVADTFIALLADNARLLAQYSPTKGLSLPNYVRRQAVLQGYNRYRKLTAHKRLVETPLDPDPRASTPGSPKARQAAYRNGAPDPETRVSAKQDLEHFLERLRRDLSPALRITFELLYVRHLTPAQAADILGCSMDVLYQRKRRLLKAVQTLLEADQHKGAP